jgi:hypothetical protein
MCDSDTSDTTERLTTERHITKSETALVDLVRLDYDGTLRALNGFAAAAAAIRGVGIAAWGIIVGIAVNDKDALLGLVAGGVTLTFVFIDAYHSALYRKTLARAIQIEALLNGYAETLGIDSDDAEAVDRVRAQLELHSFGVNRTMRRLAVTDLWDARPWPVFIVLYPVLVVTAFLVFLALDL